MAPVVPFIPLIVGAATAGTTIWAAMEQREAGREAAALSTTNVGNIREETTEQIKRVEYTSAREQGMARARAFASGAYGLTPGLYLKEMADITEEEIDWLAKSGLSQEEIEGLKGSQAKSIASAGAIATLGQGLGSAAKWFSMFG